LGAPCRDAGDGEGCMGLPGATGGRERGTGWAWLAKEHSLPSVDMQRLSSVIHKAGRGVGLIYFEFVSF